MYNFYCNDCARLRIGSTPPPPATTLRWPWSTTTTPTSSCPPACSDTASTCARRRLTTTGTVSQVSTDSTASLPNWCPSSEAGGPAKAALLLGLTLLATKKLPRWLLAARGSSLIQVEPASGAASQHWYKVSSISDKNFYFSQVCYTQICGTAPTYAGPSRCFGLTLHLLFIRVTQD